MPYYRVEIIFLNKPKFKRHVYSELELEEYYTKAHTEAQRKFVREISSFDCVQVSVQNHVIQSMIAAGAKKWPPD